MRARRPVSNRVRVFGFKLGGDKSVVGRLAAGKFKEEEKQQLLLQLTQSSPAPQELIPLLTSEDAAINSRAAQLFLARPDPGATIDLIEDLLERTQGVSAGIKVLQKCKDELVVKAVDTHLSRPRPDTVRRLWELILELQPTVSDAYLERALNDAPAPQRIAALRRLVKSRGAESMRPVLIEASSNREATVRKEAVGLLANMPGEDVFGVMLDRLSTDDSKEIRDFAGKYLQQYISKAPPEVKPRVLGRLLLVGEPEQRKQLVQSMFSSGNPGELLLGVLTFCKTLTGTQHKTVMEALKSVGDSLLQSAVALCKSADSDIRIQAVYLLEAFADPRTMGQLVGMLRDPDWWVRIVVCEAVGRLREPKTIPALKDMLSDADAKWAAIDALSGIGAPAAPTLVGLLSDPSAEVRSAVVSALQPIKDPSVDAALAGVAQKDPSVDVRLKAVEIGRARSGDQRATNGMVVSSKDLTKPIEKMLAYVRERGGSDLHITPGEPPILRLNGTLERIGQNKMEPEQSKAVLFETLDPVRAPILEKQGAVDFCYSIPGVGRYRANVFKMKRGYAGVFRSIPNRAPTLAELGLPKHLGNIGTYHQGIVLVTGPAGSGKTTTLTALVNTINDTKAAHVLTFEDPVEFLHTSKKALINQREIGKDSMTYASAMRAALREDPDIIVVGDMRDPETIRLALLASETGHLVVATMQTIGAAPTIDKLVEAFPPDEQQQVRGGLAESLKLIVSQVLVPRADGQGRIAAYEVMMSSSSVRSLIRDGKTFQLASTMTIGRSIGMQTLDGSLEERVRAGLITQDVAMQFAQSKENLAKALAAPAPRASAPPGQPGAPAAAAGARPGVPGRPAAPGAAAPLRPPLAQQKKV